MSVLAGGDVGKWATRVGFGDMALGDEEKVEDEQGLRMQVLNYKTMMVEEDEEEQ